MPHGQKNGERHKSLGFCVTPYPRSNFFLPGGKENLLVDEEIPAKRQCAREIVLKIGFFVALLDE